MAEPAPANRLPKTPKDKDNDPSLLVGTSVDIANTISNILGLKPNSSPPPSPPPSPSPPPPPPSPPSPPPPPPSSPPSPPPPPPSSPPSPPPSPPSPPSPPLDDDDIKPKPKKRPGENTTDTDAKRIKTDEIIVLEDVSDEEMDTLKQSINADIFNDVELFETIQNDITKRNNRKLFKNDALEAKFYNELRMLNKGMVRKFFEAYSVSETKVLINFMIKYYYGNKKLNINQIIYLTTNLDYEYTGEDNLIKNYVNLMIKEEPLNQPELFFKMSQFVVYIANIEDINMMFVSYYVPKREILREITVQQPTGEEMFHNKYLKLNKGKDYNVNMDKVIEVLRPILDKDEFGEQEFILLTTLTFSTLKPDISILISNGNNKPVTVNTNDHSYEYRFLSEISKNVKGDLYSHVLPLVEDYHYQYNALNVTLYNTSDKDYNVAMSISIKMIPNVNV